LCFGGFVLLATWNVNGIRARLDRLREWLTERKPDVVCLQELKTIERDFPQEELRSIGYHAALVCQVGWNGVAVLAREPPTVVNAELAGCAEQGARFVSVRTNGLEVASVYVPNGKTVENPDYPKKLAWLGELARFTEVRAAKGDAEPPLVLAGDFNVCTTDLDSYLGERGRGTIFHTEAERAHMARLAAAGLVDLFRRAHPAVPGFSWWDYRAGSFHKNEGMRIDLLLATEPVARRLKDITIDREFRKKSKTSGAVPSDHAPVVAVLD
jgi:exodeoxyribonuclease-3